MENLHISNPESTHIMNQMNTDSAQSDTECVDKRVRFDIPNIFHPSDFLSCFQFQPHVSAQESTRHRLITVSDSISLDKKVGLGKSNSSVCGRLVQEYLTSYDKEKAVIIQIMNANVITEMKICLLQVNSCFLSVQCRKDQQTHCVM